MSFIGALNFYTEFIEKLHITLNRFTTFYMRTLPGNGQMNTKDSFMSLTSETELTIPNTKHQFSLQLMLQLLD